MTCYSMDPEYDSLSEQGLWSDAAVSNIKQESPGEGVKFNNCSHSIQSNLFTLNNMDLSKLNTVDWCDENSFGNR